MTQRYCVSREMLIYQSGCDDQKKQVTCLNECSCIVLVKLCQNNFCIFFIEGLVANCFGWRTGTTATESAGIGDVFINRGW